jgi:hypothetical protein
MIAQAWPFRAATLGIMFDLEKSDWPLEPEAHRDHNFSDWDSDSAIQ